jgi:hypothetical protein
MMKREREAVWRDDDDEIATSRVKPSKVYGKKDEALPKAVDLRAHFEYD